MADLGGHAGRQPAAVATLALGIGPVTFPGHGYTAPRIGFAIDVASTFWAITGTRVGAVRPLVVSRMKMEPPDIASPAPETLVDIMGLLIQFGSARKVPGLEGRAPKRRDGFSGKMMNPVPALTRRRPLAVAA